MTASLRELELAIAHGDTKEVARLLDADPALVESPFTDNVFLTPLMWACRNRHVTVVELLLERNADANAVNQRDASGEGGNAALWFTAQGRAPGGVPIAQSLLDHGAQVNARGEFGTTPFYMAVAWVHMELVQFLLANGADPKLAHDEGETPLGAIRARHDWALAEDNKTDDMQTLLFRAPRIIAFLEKLK